MSRRQLKFPDLNATVAEVHRLQAGPYVQVGKWDLGMACQHLTKTLRMSVTKAPVTLPFFLRPIARKMMFGKIMRGEPTGLPLKTFPSFVPKQDNESERHVTEYEVVVNVVMEPDAALLPVHPIFGTVTKDEWRMFHAWHAAHHLSFLLPE